MRITAARHLLPVLILLQSVAYAQQVARRVVAEHFTNTYCSVCASRNPGLYGNLWGFPQVLHVAYHPSAPYPACPLNMHNVAENNARTNYYGVYGGTPRVVIQGVPLSSSTNYADAAIFSGVVGQTTPFSMKVAIAPVGADSVKTTIVITKGDTSSLTGLTIYAALVEDTVFFTHANGEPNSKDVFRKAVWGAVPLSITAPAMVGDSVTYTATNAINNSWARHRMYALAMLQRADRGMEQAERSGYLQGPSGMGGPVENTTLSLYPNPAGNAVYLKGATEWPCEIYIYDVAGRMIKSMALYDALDHADMLGMSAGVYVVKVRHAGNTFTLTLRKDK